MASSTMDSLFDNERLALGHQHCLPLVIYTPFGLVLCIVRAFILLHALVVHSILPQTSTLRSVVLRVMLAVTGLVITSHGDEGRDSRARVLVANHVSPLDHMVTSLVVPHILPIEWGGSALLQWLLGLHRFAPDLGREELIRTAKKFCEGSALPLLFFPEKIPTSGKSGLLKFSALAFKLNCTIQPIGIKTRRICPFPVNLSTSNSAWWADLFWCLFVPFTVFKVKFLPVTQKKEGESEEDLCERVRGNMARGLDLQLSEFSAADIMERRKRPPPAAATAIPPSPKTERETVAMTEESCLQGQTPEMVQMVRQIKEVLSNAPTPAILKDLLVTRDVDLTITNFLEGRVLLETSLPAPSPSNSTSASTSFSASTSASASASASPSSSSCVSAQAPANLQFKASEFGKSTKDRQMSFQERKQAMIEAARRKYMAKHGMI